MKFFSWWVFFIVLCLGQPCSSTNYFEENPELNFIYVAQNNSATGTGDGSYENPYKNISLAISQINNNCATKPYLIKLSMGTYNESIVVKPFVAIVGGYSFRDDTKTWSIMSNLYAFKTTISSPTETSIKMNNNTMIKTLYVKGGTISGIKIENATNVFVKEAILSNENLNSNGIVIENSSATIGSENEDIRIMNFKNGIHSSVGSIVSIKGIIFQDNETSIISYDSKNTIKNINMWGQDTGVDAIRSEIIILRSKIEWAYIKGLSLLNSFSNIEYCTIRNCGLDRYGYGVFISGGTSEIKDSQIYKNNTGIYLENNNLSYISNCIIAKNTWGGIRSKITEFDDSFPYVLNTVIVGNDTFGIVPNQNIDDYFYRISHSRIQDRLVNSSGIMVHPGYTSTYPSFIDFSRDNFKIQSNSPLINYGLSPFEEDNSLRHKILKEDAYGTKRDRQNDLGEYVCNIGIHEFEPPSPTPTLTPTWTPAPTYTPTNTSPPILTPTNTPTPTETSTSTPLFTATPTPTQTFTPAPTDRGIPSFFTHEFGSINLNSNINKQKGNILKNSLFNNISLYERNFSPAIEINDLKKFRIRISGHAKDTNRNLNIIYVIIVYDKSSL